MRLCESLPYLDKELVYKLECICPKCGNKHEVKEFWGEGIPKTPRIFCKGCKKVIDRRIKYEKERGQ